MNKNNIPTYQQFKRIVVDKFNTEYKEKGYKLSHVYNQLSKDYGFNNWNTLAASLKQNDKQNGICWNCENTGTVGKEKECRECYINVKEKLTIDPKTTKRLMLSNKEKPTLKNNGSYKMDKLDS